MNNRYKDIKYFTKLIKTKNCKFNSSWCISEAFQGFGFLINTDNQAPFHGCVLVILNFCIYQ